MTLSFLGSFIIVLQIISFHHQGGKPRYHEKVSSTKNDGTNFKK